ncbi:alpha/beta hydrolase [Brevundimonas sp. S30B]|uniref:alpha/beta fold hydrolase n=1 Tax=unclassified Brevundimonas TaxID=2622653 RepID=UPI001072AE0A|nr:MULTISPECIES: alpha/beta hydrolase [unclassified Brevundimonas]QBX38774.1 alpha/beta hydrolase [Brevundimonas sp. MF30-B]TFW01366.1 alpha/beta hydrolase [Brevundimonas sp. S30B]
MIIRLLLGLTAALILSMHALSATAFPAQQGSAEAFRSDRILVETRGSGPDVILIPGLASTADVWRRTADELSGRRVHLVTVRGFGDVPAGANASGVVVAPVAQEIRRYIAEHRLDRPAVIGHSMGGQVALRVAADARGDVGRVMVVDASPFFPALISPGATVGDVDPIARIAYQAVMFLGDDALRLQGRRMGADLGGAAEAVFGTLGWQGGDRRVLAQTLYEVMTTDLRSRLPDITAPVTVVYGWSADDRSPRARIDELFRSGYRSLRTPARFERIEGAEHMVMIDQPRRFMAAVERFLADG